MRTIRLLSCKSTHPVPCGNPFNVCSEKMTIIPGIPTVVRTGIQIELENNMDLRGKSIKSGIDVISVFLSETEVCVLVTGEGKIEEDECFAGIEVVRMIREPIRFFLVKPTGRMICGDSKVIK